MKLLTDDCDVNQNQLEVFVGGNGDYYIAVIVDGVSHAVRISTSGGNASTKVKLAVANLYRAMNEKWDFNDYPKSESKYCDCGIPQTKALFNGIRSKCAYCGKYENPDQE